MGAEQSRPATVGDLMCMMCMQIALSDCGPAPSTVNEQHRARIEILADRFALRTDQVKQMLALSDEFPVMDVEQLYKEALARQWSSRQWQARFDEFIRAETDAK
jgi:hypothetical protein